MSKSDKVIVLAGTAASSISAVLAAQGSPLTVTKPSAMGKTEHMMAMAGEVFMMSDGELLDPDRVTFSEDRAEYMVAKEQMTPTTDSDGLPNRLSIDRSSPYHTSCGAYVGVKIDGAEAPNCIEFCVSEGWVRLGNATGARVSQHEIQSAPKQCGKVEVYWKATPSRQVRRQMARLAR
jgi:hypothetical protein